MRLCHIVCSLMAVKDYMVLMKWSQAMLAMVCVRLHESDARWIRYHFATVWDKGHYLSPIKSHITYRLKLGTLCCNAGVSSL